MNAPETITNVKHSMFSIARHYGSVRFNKRLYYYDPVADVLTRADVLKARKEWRIIVSPGPDQPDEYLGEPHPTRARALKAARAGRNGRACVLFGPEGIDLGTWMEADGNGK